MLRSTLFHPGSNSGEGGRGGGAAARFSAPVQTNPVAHPELYLYSPCGPSCPVPGWTLPLSSSPTINENFAYIRVFRRRLRFSKPVTARFRQQRVRYPSHGSSFCYYVKGKASARVMKPCRSGGTAALILTLRTRPYAPAALFPIFIV
jgi:hypothetical protein